jgi:hypothetical protein
MAKVYLNPGHGDDDPGACGFGRREADDVLGVALAVGRILSSNGLEVAYTRTTNGGADAHMANYVPQVNREGCDFFVSFHRNASGAGAAVYETCVYSNQGYARAFADSMNYGMEALGYTNRGTKIRTDLYVLNSTDMPAVLMELGFIDNGYDNSLFVNKYNEMVNLIARSILETLGMSMNGDGDAHDAPVPAPEAPQPEPVPVEPDRTDDLGGVDCIYQAYTGRWWDAVKNREDWAGAGDGEPIRYLAVCVSKGTITGQVYTQANGWLPKLTFSNTYDINDLENGVLGDGSPIEAVMLYLQYTRWLCV